MDTEAATDNKPYTIEAITPLPLKVISQRHKWSLGHPTRSAVLSNPIIASDEDTRFTAVAILRHHDIPEHTYYLDDVNTPHGWKVSDCKPAPKEDNIYTVLKGERIHTVARKLKMDEKELMEHNDLSYNVPLTEGQTLHLPVAREKIPPTITFKYEGYPKWFYINKAEGARKYAFGNVKDKKHIVPFGATNPKHKRVEIHAEARVTVDGEEYCYYQDAVSVGKAYGYAWEHLLEGEPPEKPAAHPTASEIKATLEAIEPVAEPPVVPEEPLNATKWRMSYVPYPEPVLMRTRIAQDVIDYGGNRPTKEHFYGNVLIAGEFKKYDNLSKKLRTYGRPIQAVEAKFPNWFGIETSNLETVQNKQEIAEAQAMQLEVTPVSESRKIVYADELFRTVVAKPLAHSVKIMDRAKKQIKKVKVIQ